MRTAQNTTVAELMELVREGFKVFGRTPMSKRLAGIEGEAIELRRNLDIAGQMDESGDLLCELMAYFNETGFDPVQRVLATQAKIERRRPQYASLGRRFNVGIYGGAFNPISIGHIETAQLALNTGMLDEVWLMPAFTHLFGKKMLPPMVRLDHCRKAANVDARIKVSDYEIENEMGGETYHLLMRMLEDSEFDSFRLHVMIGLDNANGFHKWSNHEELERAVPFVVIPRAGETIDPNHLWYMHPPHRFIAADAPTEISSTVVRNLINAGDPASLLTAQRYLHPAVYKDIIVNGYYR